MESTKGTETFAQYAEGKLEAVVERLRNRVPFVDTEKAKTVEELLHRVISTDFVTNRRYKQLAVKVIELEPKLTRARAMDLIARVLGYCNYYTASATMGDTLKIINLRKPRRHRPRGKHKVVAHV